MTLMTAHDAHVGARHWTRSVSIAALVLVTSACATPPGTIDPATAASDSAPIRVLLAGDVDWQALNPARGDQSPRAGTLWGDRHAAVPTGFLAEFVDGFSSPPHIHNVTYRAVVISGEIHNDDPHAEPMWMPSGSFWTQPGGEAHITAARGDNNLALVEIDRGPYWVKPPLEAFDSGERPINVDVSNLVWLPLAADPGPDTSASVAYLWGRQEAGESRGVFLQLPPGFNGVLSAPGDEFHAVVIAGTLGHTAASGQRLSAGSYFGAAGASVHDLTAGTDQAVVIYIRSNDQFQLSARQP
ncbi:MAG: DUF4437 domain-containing protein [Pseudomonadota bacterium]